ncbi:MAG TPA: hypothetical protein ENK63_05520 [Rhodobacterales bacterium]|nr:hypothetical protein [Rhodobacterales bacterium]
MDITRLARIWAGEAHDEYGEAAVIGSMAIALRTMGKADSMQAADTLAAQIWAARDKGKVPASA